MTSRHPLRTLALGLAVTAAGGLALQGCLPAETEGKGGNLAFAYRVVDAITGPGLDTPVAVGASMGIKVFLSDGDRTPVTVNSASVFDSGVFTVDGAEADVVTVTAQSAGTTELSVDTTGGTDAVNILAVPLDRAEITLPRVLGDPEPSELVFAQGGIARFGMTLFDASGGELTGYGLDVVTTEPTGAVTPIDSTDVEHLRLQMTTAGDIRVIPTDGQELQVTVVATSEIASLVINDGDGDATDALPELNVDAETFVFLEAELADTRRVIGLEGLYTLSTSTPEICEVTPNTDYAFLEQLTEGAVQVKGLSAGTCQISATVGEITAEAEMTIR